MNLAATWRVPLLYACVNNGYAISTPVGYSHATADLVDFARAYKIPAVQVDGNDIAAAYAATRAAVEHLRAGHGPYFVEYKTWRWQGIFSGEFRPADEVRYYREEHDPIKMARAALLTKGIATEAVLAELEAGVGAEIEGWIDFAKASPPPDPAKATANVYAGWEVATR
jgi:TPP-dependent pyruvate/acetoin dehydrogenase alpha subunit